MTDAGMLTLSHALQAGTAVVDKGGLFGWALEMPNGRSIRPGWFSGLHSLFSNFFLS